ncbi:MAG: helix-turn-helix domain-containing protein [Solirubrobacterales bacterium]
MAADSLLQIIASRLRSLRDEKGLTQAQLGEIAGLSGPMISHIERCQHWPSLPQLATIADALGVPVAYFLTSPDEGNRARIVHILEGLAPEDAELGAAILATIARQRDARPK